MGTLAMDENKREPDGMSDVRMDLPTHEEATMWLFSMIHYSVDKARGARLRCSTECSKKFYPRLHWALDISSKLRASAPGGIREVDNNIVSRDELHKLPEPHVCQQLGRVVGLLLVEVLGVIERWQQRICFLIGKLGSQSQRSADDRQACWLAARFPLCPEDREEKHGKQYCR